MHVADLVIDQPRTQTQELVRTYESVLGPETTFVTAESQFERDCLILSEDGWQLKLVSHRGSIVSPHTVVASYEKQ